MWMDRSRKSDPACYELLDRLLVEPTELLELLTPEHLASHTRRLKPEAEIVELLGLALWDIFSHNNRVADVDGADYDFGSFRGSADFIAESMNRRYADLESRYDYLDFYMGSMGSGERSDLRPLYRWIFGRLKDEGCDWIYYFPRIHLIDLSGMQPTDDPYAYDPSEALRAEMGRSDEVQRVEDLTAELDRAYEDDVREARNRSLPLTVAAYRDVFGVLPRGWPHPDM